jgi:hypothetical protein
MASASTAPTCRVARPTHHRVWEQARFREEFRLRICLVVSQVLRPWTLFHRHLPGPTSPYTLTPAIGSDTITGCNDGLRRTRLRLASSAPARAASCTPMSFQGRARRWVRIRLVTDTYKLRAVRLDVVTAYRTITVSRSHSDS